MADFTSRLRLRKPAVGEKVNVESDLNQNFDEIDKHVGTFLCTSGTRPASPWVGMKIFETDTGIEYVRTGTGNGWQPSGGAPVYAKYRRNATDSASPLTVANSTWQSIVGIGGLIEESNGTEWSNSSNFPLAPRYGQYLYEAQVTFPRVGDIPNASGNASLTNLTRIGLEVVGYNDANLFGLQIQGASSAGGGAVTFKSTGIITLNPTTSRTLKLMAYQSSGGSLAISNIQTYIKLKEL